MSYILDALKKAEQTRGHGEVPGLFAVQTGASSARRSSVPLWPIALLIINGAALFYWLQHRLTEPVSPPQRPAVIAPPSVANIDPIPPGVADSLPKAPEASVVAPLPREITAKPTAGKQEPAGARKNKPPSETPIAAPLVPRNVDANMASRQNAPQLAELPLEVQQEIPKLAVAMHMYSDKPANRLVTINDKPWREGEEISPGLRLVEITVDGMIFTYKTFTFRKGIS